MVANRIDWAKFEQHLPSQVKSRSPGYPAGKDGDLYKLYLRGTNNTYFAYTNVNAYVNRFTNDWDSVAKKIACSGNIETLLDWKTVAKGEHPKMAPYAFSFLFRRFCQLETPPDLPATNLTAGCYDNLFGACVNLTNAPVLPATVLTQECYQNMFKGCSALCTPPELPSTNLADNCYYQMLYGTGVKDLPNLPAKVLKKTCYNSMFFECGKQFGYDGGLVVNTNGPGRVWSIPKDAVIPQGEVSWQAWNYRMFFAAGGNITNETNAAPIPGKTYYVASAPKAELTVTPVTGVSTVKVMEETWEVTGPSYSVYRGNSVTVTCTVGEGYIYSGDTTTWSTNFTATADSMVLTPPTPIEVTCKRAELESGESTNLVAGTTYKAAPTAEMGGAFFLNPNTTLIGTNVTFAGNEATAGGAIYVLPECIVKLVDAVFENNKSSGRGGAIYNGAYGELTLENVTFRGNSPKANGGAIANLPGGTVKFDGTVTLATETDTISNTRELASGTLNWNLANGKHGLLNGYQNIYNTGTLKITVDDAIQAPTNIVIATGDFSNIEGKDTFRIADVAGCTANLVIDGEKVLCGTRFYQLKTEAAGATTNLVLSVPTEPIPFSLPGLPWNVTTNVYTNVVSEATRVDANVLSPLPAFVVYNVETATGTNWYFKGDVWVKAITNKLDTTQNPAVDPEIGNLPELIAVTAVRTELGAGQSTNLVEGMTYTAAPVDEPGGAFNVKGGSLYATNVTFAGNVATWGGAIMNQSEDGTPGFVSLNGVTFTGNSSSSSETSGAIHNCAGCTVELDGAVTLTTATDKIDNNGILNWNLADGAAGCLNGYDKLVNSDGELRLTVDDKILAPSNIVIATGDFSSIWFKDTFTVSNATTGAVYDGATIGEGGVGDENLAYAVKLVEEEPAGSGVTNLVLTTFVPVCRIISRSGDTTNYFETVEAAAAAADYGETIQFLRSAEIDIYDAVDKDVTIDLNGQFITNKYLKVNNFDTIENSASGEGGLMNTGIVEVTSDSFLNLTSLNWGAGGLIQSPDGSGKFVIAEGGSVQMNGLSPNWMEANAPGCFADCETGALVCIGADDPVTYAKTASGIWTTDGAVAAAEKDGFGSYEHQPIRYNEVYTDLQKAIDGVASNGTVTLLAYITTNVTFSVTNDYACTLDLNGKHLTGEGDQDFLEVRSPLTILDNRGGGAISSKSGNCPVAAYTNLYVRGGGIQGTPSYAICVKEGGNVEISRGMIYDGYTPSTNVFVSGGAFYNVPPAASNIVEGFVCYQTKKTPAWKVTQGVTLSNVGIDGTSNVVEIAGFPFAAGEDDYLVPSNLAVTITYRATDDKIIGPGWTEKTITLDADTIGGGYDMADDPGKKSIADKIQERWVDADGGREIALDTRERIVVAAPEEVLPIAYSTNGWGAVEGGEKVYVMAIDPEGNIKDIVEMAAENGYEEWMPKREAYGKYEFRQSWWDVSEETLLANTNATIYYSQPYALTWATPVGGTIAVTNAGVAVASGDQVLGYSLLNLAATPTYNGHERYEFTGWTAKTNGVEWAEAFKDPMALTQTLEMPNAATELAGGFQWKSNYTENISVAGPVVWEVREGEDYSEGTVSVMNGGTFSSKYAVSVTALTVAAGSTNVWDFTENGQPSFRVAQFYNSGTLEILFDSTLTNGVYTLLTVYPPTGFSGVTSFRITDGTTAKDCSVDGGYVYVGAKRFKIALSTTGMGAAAFILTVESGLPMALTYAQPDGGTITAYTNGAEVVSGEKVLPAMTVTVVATTNLHWQFNGWSGTDATGVDVPFAEPLSATTTFKMPETNATVTANFIVSEAYKAETAQAITNAANAAIAAVNGMNLSQDEKDGYNGQILRDRDAQVAAAVGATVPAGVSGALAAANTAFGATKEAAQAYADQTWAITPVVAYTNIAGVVTVTNESQARLDVGVVATTNLCWQFVNWTGVDAAGNELTFADETSATTTFEMPETNVTVTANFIVSEAYKAELQKALDDKYTATTNAIEALRLNRLTDDETDKALSVVKGDYDAATRDISNAPTPKAAEDAKNFADATLSALAKNVGEFSDAKPYDLIVADDFEAIADEGSYDPETGAFTVNGVAYTNGVNAFTSFRAAYGAADTAFTTNVHVYGTQLIEDDVPNLYPWTLDLHDAVLSIGIDENKNLYASITNALNAITGGEGIVFGKTEDDETRAVKAVLDDVAKASGADITVKAADVTPTKTGEGEDEVIEAKVDEKAKTTDGVTTLPQLVSDEGSINITVESTVTNDTVVAGKVAAPEGTVTIVHYPTSQALTVAGEVTAKNVVIDNYGHLEANATAAENITIDNHSVNTLVGTYEAKSIVMKGYSEDPANCKCGAISNVTFRADALLLSWMNQLTGPLTLEVGAVTNDFTFAWNVRNGSHAAYLNNLDVIVDDGWYGAYYTVMVDYDQALGDYILADNAASAANRNLRIELYDGDTMATVHYGKGEELLGETWYPGDSRGYTLTVNAANQLVLTVGWGGVRFAESEKTGSFGEPIDVEVDGGMPDRPTQVTVSLQKNTLTSYKAYDKATGKRVSFPLTLNWDAGTRETKVITVVPKKGSGSSADDVRFLTLQLGSEVGQLLVAPQVCTVTVGDPEADDTLYVRALPWPANGGKVSGYGEIKTDRYGEVKTKRTLKVKANKWATFVGWYAAKADNPNEIDLANKITDATTLNVGKGTDYVNGTFYAYFTDVLAVAAVNLPDATAAGATGVTGDGVRTYTGMAGVKFSLPIDSDDDEAKMSVSYLPSGLKYNKTTGCIEGVPTRACAKTVTITAKNAAGKHKATFDFVIDELPYNAIGTWNGVVRQLDDPDDGTHAGFGTVQFSATSAGKLTAKVTTRLTGTKSFSVKGYDYVDENMLGIAMATRNGEIFNAVLSLTNDWKTAQIAGTVEGGKFAANGEEVKFAAIRNAFEKKDKNQEALDFLAEYKGEYEDTLTATNGDFVGSVTFKVKDGGKVQVKAKSVNDTYSATCAGAFRATPKDFGAVQTAVRSSKRLWACDALLDAETGDAAGLACDYDADGEDTHEVIGTSVPWASGSPSEMRIRGVVAK